MLLFAFAQVIINLKFMMGGKADMNLKPAIRKAVQLSIFVMFVMTLALNSSQAVFAQADGSNSSAKSTDSKKSDDNELKYYSKEEDGYSESIGITVSTTLDKDSYKSGDTAQVTMEVKNTNAYDVTDMKVKCKLPDNIEAADGKKTFAIDKLAAGETQKITFKASVTEDDSAPLVEGAYNSYIYIGIAVFVVIAALIIFVFTKKKGKKTLSMFLAVILAAGGIMNVMPKSVSAAGESKSVQENESENKSESDAAQDDKGEPTTETGNYSVPIEKFFLRTSVHDPSIVKDPKTGMYYVFGTHLSFAKSKNLMEWDGVYTNINEDYEKLFKEPWDGWAEPATAEDVTLFGRLWAPDVIWNDTMKKWCMYMSVDGDSWTSSICLLTADDIEGPYEYKGVVVYSGMNNSEKHVDEKKTDIYKVLGEGADLSPYKSTAYSCINAIDPNVMFDDDGELYMTYGSWSAGIYQLKLDKSTGLRDYNTTYETKRDVSDAYFGTKIAGGYYCSGEGPYILHTGGYYYLFLSYGGLNAVEGYQMRIYRSENISGPYTDQNGVSAIRTEREDMIMKDYGMRLFGSYNMYGIETVQVAQGHNSAFVDDDGKIFVVYHSRFQSDDGTSEFHHVKVHQLFINTDGWLVAAPYEYSGETISDIGYAMEDMAGTYEFIYHEPTSYYKVAGDKQLGIIGRSSKGRSFKGTKSVTIGKHISEFSFDVEFKQESADTVTLNEDGTVTGAFSGKWSHDKEKMTLDLGNGYVFNGVFLKQANEDSRDMTMTFTAAGKNVTEDGDENESNE